MADPWLHVVGIGEDGWDGLAPPARAALEKAEVIVGGRRHHDLAPHLTAERVTWPSPFRAMVEEIASFRGRPTAVLVTGDPLWFSAGAFFARSFPTEELCYHPQISAFQLACARMQWSLADVETLTVHGRPAEQAIPAFAPGARLVILTQDGTSPATLAGHLDRLGYGPSRLTVLASLGGPDETRIDGTASTWTGDAPDFHTLCIECAVAPGYRPLPRTNMPDDAFVHDGKLTKREVRAVTLARLQPARGALLWDIGTGSGAVAIEWMRAAPDARAIGLDPNAERRAMAARNATALGAPRLELVDAAAPEGLADLSAPDAIFIGGGLSVEVADRCLTALRPQGRLVANAVTLESEALLTALHGTHGGDLTRLSVGRADPVGRYRGWRQAMPVTQWVFER
ncbi:MAG: precorrin-6y C5,15-methyltransferase (decarboxylating) subunit CbiE [Pseudomonadota bacterium]